MNGWMNSLLLSNLIVVLFGLGLFVGATLYIMLSPNCQNTLSIVPVPCLNDKK
jgi:hypothetical protein